LLASASPPGENAPRISGFDNVELVACAEHERAHQFGGGLDAALDDIKIIKGSHRTEAEFLSEEDRSCYR
jgi:hypothetical protein